MPVTIVRPSIIESALAEPRPGWIRGFRMAEPVIICYARGLLKEFPACPRASSTSSRSTWSAPPSSPWPPRARASSNRGRAGRLRLVRTRCATAARRPRQRLVHRAPALRRQGPAHRRARVVASPAAAACRASCSGPRSASTGPRACCRRCRCGASRPSGSATLEEKREEADRALGYVELYGAYAECEAVYGARPAARPVGLARRRTTRRLLLRPPCHRLGRLRPRSTCPRSCSRLGCKHHARRVGSTTRDPSACARRCSPPSASWRRSTSRTR